MRGGQRRRRVYCLLGHTLECIDHELRFVRHGLDAQAGDLLVIDMCQAYGSPADPELLRARDPVLTMPLPAAEVAWLAGPVLRYGKDVNRVELSLELDLHRGLPGSYAIDAVVTAHSPKRAPRRFVMRQYKRYDAARLGQSLSPLGWELLAMPPVRGSGDQSTVAMVWVRRDD